MDKLVEWEYKVVDIDQEMLLSVNKENPEGALNRWGRTGWEMVGTVENDMGGTQAVIFKRPKSGQVTDSSPSFAKSANSERGDTSSPDKESPFDGDGYDKGPTENQNLFESCPKCSSDDVWFAQKGEYRRLKCSNCQSIWKEVEKSGLLSSEQRWKMMNGVYEGEVLPLSEWKSKF